MCRSLFANSKMTRTAVADTTVICQNGSHLIRPQCGKGLSQGRVNRYKVLKWCPSSHIRWIHIVWILLYDVINLRGIQSVLEDGISRNVSEESVAYFLYCNYSDQYWEMHCLEEVSEEIRHATHVVVSPHLLSGARQRATDSPTGRADGHTALLYSMGAAVLKKSVLILFEIWEESIISTDTCGHFKVHWKNLISHFVIQKQISYVLRNLNQIHFSSKANIWKYTVTRMSMPTCSSSRWNPSQNSPFRGAMMGLLPNT